MKKLLFVTVMAFLISAASYSQSSYTLSGVVVDSAKGYGLPDVNVSILSRDKNETLTGTTTDEKGNFTAENIANKNIRVRFSFVGYQTKVVDSVSLENTSKIGLVRLRGTGITLPEVVVKTIKPMIEYTVDRRIVNLDQVPGNAASVTEALRNSGAVEVDPVSNKITVRGESVKIQMDGRPYEMPDNMLAQMPAQMLEQVEVILAPSAKESAEGGTYILNLISKKNKFDNFNGSLSINTATSNQTYGGTNFNYKTSKLNIFGSLYGGRYLQDYVHESEQINYNSIGLYHQLSENAFASEGLHGNVKLGFDYDVNVNNFFTFYGTFNLSNSDWGVTNKSQVRDNSELLRYTYNNRSNMDNKHYSGSLYTYYKRKFEKKGHELTVDAMFTNISSPQTSDMNVTYSADPLHPELHKTETIENAHTLIFKSDYIYPSEIGKFEAGYHFIFRNRKNDYTSLDYLYSSNSWSDSMKLGNLFKYNEDIHAAYITYNKSFGKIELKTGVRVENLHTNGEQITSSENFNGKFLNVFPNLNISYKINEMFQVGFNSFRRVRYPQLYSVNPFKVYNSPNSYSTGNPQLKPTFINSFGVNLSRYIDAYYVYSTGLSNYETSVIDDSISFSSPYNMSSMKNYGIELNLPYYNSPMMPFHLPDFVSMLNISFGYNYRKQSGSYLNEDLNYAGNYTWLDVRLGLKLWYNINSNIFCSYTPKTENRRKIREENIYLNLSFSRAFFDQKLQIVLGISDPLKLIKYKNTTYGTAFFSRSEYSMVHSRSVSLGITYRINDYRERSDRNLDDGRDAGNTSKF